MINFIFVALCTWITTILPFKNVSVPSANEEVVEVIETKERKEYINNYGWLITTPYELLSSYPFIDNLNQNLYPITQQDTIYTLPPYYLDDCYFVWSSNADYTDPDRVVTNHGFSFTNIEFKFIRDYSLSGRTLKNFYCTFSFSNNASLTFITSLVYNPTSTSIGFLGCAGIVNADFNTYGFPFGYFYLRSSSYLYNNAFTFNQDYDEGVNYGQQVGYDRGYLDGKEFGEAHPNQDVTDRIYDRGYTQGFTEGFNSVDTQDEVASVIFTGILDVSMIPVNIFIQMFDYEILGINIAGLISGLMTVALILILVRFVTGRHI